MVVSRTWMKIRVSLTVATGKAHLCLITPSEFQLRWLRRGFPRVQRSPLRNNLCGFVQATESVVKLVTEP